MGPTLSPTFSWNFAIDSIVKKKPGYKNPAKFNREASRLGDVGSINRPFGPEDPTSRCCTLMINQHRYREVFPVLVHMYIETIQNF